MAGRPKKPEIPLFRDLDIEDAQGNSFTLKKIQIKCPICGSAHVRDDGTKQSGNTRLQSYQCRNQDCIFLENHKQGKQFTIFSSLFLQMIIVQYLQSILQKIGKSEGKMSTIGNFFTISSSLMTYLNQKLQESIDQQHGLHHLVSNLQDDRAIALDETFLKINGRAYYIIIATGYSLRKVLGIKVSKTRKMEDIREVFMEADKNTQLPINIITADAWGATRACAKNLNRKITIIIHKHKKPYQDVVIEKYQYEENLRKITTIGVKSDFTKRRAKREYHYMEKTENLAPSKKKGPGRPKRVKNGQGKKK